MSEVGVLGSGCAGLWAALGGFAGYHVIGEPMPALRIPWYVTVLDLGTAGAVYTEGLGSRG